MCFNTYRHEGHDLAPAAEILESACHCVSRAMRRSRQRNHIHSIDSYLYWAFVRKYSRRMAREARIQYVESMETFTDGRIEPDHSWVSMLEDEIQFKQFLSLSGPEDAGRGDSPTPGRFMGRDRPNV